MRPSRFTKEKIAAILKEAQQGIDLKTLCKKHQICAGTYYKWRAKYDCSTSTNFKKIYQLQQENRHLLALYARVCKEIIILQEAMEGKL